MINGVLTDKEQILSFFKKFVFRPTGVNGVYRHMLNYNKNITKEQIQNIIDELVLEQKICISQYIYNFNRDDTQDDN